MEVYEAKKARVHGASRMRMIIVLLETEAVLLPVTTFSTIVDILRIGFKYIYAIEPISYLLCAFRQI